MKQTLPEPSTPVFTPATADDMPFVRATIERMRLDGEHVEIEQFIVVREAGAILAFGRVKPYGGGVFELGSVGVIEAARGRGLGEAVVRELIRRFPTDDVWITTDLTAWFERLGFRAVDRAATPAPLVEKLERICGKLREGVIPMHLRRGGA